MHVKRALVRFQSVLVVTNKRVVIVIGEKI